MCGTPVLAMCVGAYACYTRRASSIEEAAITQLNSIAVAELLNLEAFRGFPPSNQTSAIIISEQPTRSPKYPLLASVNRSSKYGNSARVAFALDTQANPNATDKVAADP